MPEYPLDKRYCHVDIVRCIQERMCDKTYTVLLQLSNFQWVNTYTFMLVLFSNFKNFLKKNLGRTKRGRVFSGNGMPWLRAGDKMLQCLTVCKTDGYRGVDPGAGGPAPQYCAKEAMHQPDHSNN